MAMGAWYTTRRRFMRAADIKGVAYAADEADAIIEASSRDVDRLIRRGDATRPGLAPWYGTRLFDWPAPNNDGNFRFWLGQHKLISKTAVTSGGVTITNDVLLWPPQSGPPYHAIDIDRSTDSVLTIGDGVGQQSLSVTGLWGHTDIEKTLSTWTLGGDINASVTSATLNAPVDVGSIVRIGTERLIVTEQAWASSGQTGTLTSSVSAQSLAVSNGAAFFPGETLLIESERVIVQDIAGNTLTVKRAVDGTTLAAHAGATVYYLRTCTVERGALGSTAAAHSSGAQLYVWQPPALAEQLTTAYGLDTREQVRSAYARTIGTDENQRNAGRGGVKSLEARVEEAFGRPVRMAAV
jgi:hypothetical protein